MKKKAIGLIVTCMVLSAALSAQNSLPTNDHDQVNGILMQPKQMSSHLPLNPHAAL